MLRIAGLGFQQLTYFYIKQYFWPSLWADVKLRAKAKLYPEVYDEDWEFRHGPLVPSPHAQLPDVDTEFSGFSDQPDM